MQPNLLTYTSGSTELGGVGAGGQTIIDVPNSKMMVVGTSAYAGNQGLTSVQQNALGVFVGTGNYTDGSGLIAYDLSTNRIQFGDFGGLNDM